MSSQSDTAIMPQLNTRATLVFAWVVAGILPAIVSFIWVGDPATPYKWVLYTYIDVAVTVWTAIGNGFSAIWRFFTS